MAAVTQQHPDTRALARFLLAVTVCTIALLVGLVAVIGVTTDGPAPSPVTATATAR